MLLFKKQTLESLILGAPKVYGRNLPISQAKGQSIGCRNASVFPHSLEGVFHLQWCSWTTSFFVYEKIPRFFVSPQMLPKTPHGRKSEHHVKWSKQFFELA